MSGSVWVIEQGSYSDYRVMGIYTTRELAEAIAAKINRKDEDGFRYGDDASVEEWPLDPGAEALNQGLRKFNVTMLRDGTTEHVREQDNPWDGLGSSFHVWERTKAPAYKGKGIPDALRADVWARDEEHAVKITNEHRLGLIAGGKWKP